MKFLKFIALPLVLFISFYLFVSLFLFPSHIRPTARHVATLKYISGLKDIEQMDYLIIGDSTCLHNIVPERLSVHSYGACFSGASLMDVYYQLKKLDLKKVSKGVIFSNSFNGELHYGDDFWRRNILLGSYSLRELNEMYEESRGHGLFPASILSKSQFFFRVLKTRYFLNTLAYATLSEQLFLVRSKDLGESLLAALKKRHGFLPMSLSRENVQIADDLYFAGYEKFYSRPFLINKTDQYYFEKILALISQRGLPVYFVEPILSDSVTKKGARLFQEEYRRFFKQRMGQIKGGRYLIQDATPFKREDFFDYNHLQFSAAHAATDNLFRQIKMGQD